MTRADAKRLSLWANGTYLLGTDSTGFSDGLLDEKSAAKIVREQYAIAESLILRSRIPADLTGEEAIAFIQAEAARRQNAK